MEFRDQGFGAIPNEGGLNSVDGAYRQRKFLQRPPPMVQRALAHGTHQPRGIRWQEGDSLRWLVQRFRLCPWFEEALLYGESLAGSLVEGPFCTVVRPAGGNSAQCPAAVVAHPRSLRILVALVISIRLNDADDVYLQESHPK